MMDHFCQDLEVTKREASSKCKLWVACGEAEL